MKHPLIALEQRYSREGAVGVVVVTIAVAVLVAPEGSTLAFWAILAGSALVATGAAVADQDADESELAKAKREYAEGNITIHEFEARAEVILDEEAQRIRDVVEEVNGVGPETSTAIALAFDSRADVERADHEDLEAIHGVGPSTTDAIVEHVRGRA